MKTLKTLSIASRTPALLALAAALALSPACAESEDEERDPHSHDAMDPADLKPEVRLPGAKDAAWTVMVYLNGDNDLGANDETQDGAALDLAEMAKGMAAAGDASDRVNVIVMYDQSAASVNPDTRVYRITKDGKTRLKTDGKVFSGHEADMSAPSTLKKFGAWAVGEYPADHYALILWDHGDGWRDGASASSSSADSGSTIAGTSGGNSGSAPGDFQAPGHPRCAKGFNLLPGSGRGGSGTDRSGVADCSGALEGLLDAPGGFRGFSSDETSGGTSTITLADGSLSKALEAIVSKVGAPLDVIGFDACLMGMYEVAAALQGQARYLVASEESVPGTGWAYDTFLKALGASPDTSPAALANAMVDTYGAQSWSYGGRTFHPCATMAVYDLDSLSPLSLALDAFGNALSDAWEASSSHRSALRSILRSVQRFDYSEHADLRHMAQLVKESAGKFPADVAALAQSVMDAVDASVVHAHVQTDDKYWDWTHDSAFGMAVFLPQSIDCRYFAKDEDYSYVYGPAYFEKYGKDFVLSLSPCIYYPDEDAENSGWYTLRDLDHYADAGWSDGWARFLKDVVETPAD